MTYARQLKKRMRFSLPSGMNLLNCRAVNTTAAKNTMRPRGFRTIANIQGSMG